MSSIADMIESRIQRDADIKARQDAVRFEADLRALVGRHGLDDFARSVSGPAVAAYIDARRDQLVDRERDAVIARLFDRPVGQRIEWVQPPRPQPKHED